jgi:hypothetical protein
MPRHCWLSRRWPILTSAAGSEDSFLPLGVRRLSCPLARLLAGDFLVRPSCRLPATHEVVGSAALVAFQAPTEERWPGRIRLRRELGVDCIVIMRPARPRANRRSQSWRPSHGKRWFAPGRRISGRARRGTGCIGRLGCTVGSSSTTSPSSPGLSSTPDLSGAPGLSPALNVSRVPGHGANLAYDRALIRAVVGRATPCVRLFESFVLSWGCGPEALGVTHQCVLSSQRR